MSTMAHTPSIAPGQAAVIKDARRRQRQRRTRLLLSAIVVGLAAGLYLTFDGGVRSVPPLQTRQVPSTAATARGGNVRVYRIAGIGLLVTPGYLKSEIELPYPSSGWYVTNRPPDAISNPVQMFVLSSYRVPVGRPNVDGPATPPTPAPTGVIARLLQDQPLPSNAASGPARPSRFALPRLNPHMEGYSGRWGTIDFVDDRIPFTLFISIGRHAPAALITQLLRVLDRMTITVTFHREPD
jgi:hypothetical protein